MSGEGHHVDEVADLGIAAVVRAVEHQGQIQGGKLVLQPSHHGDRGVR